MSLRRKNYDFRILKCPRNGNNKLIDRLNNYMGWLLAIQPCERFSSNNWVLVSLFITYIFLMIQSDQIILE